MRLHVLAREGDYIETRHFTWANVLARHLMELSNRPANDDADIEVDRLWSELYGIHSHNLHEVQGDPAGSIAKFTEDLVVDLGIANRHELMSLNRPELYSYGRVGSLRRVDLVELPTLRTFDPRSTLRNEGIENGDWIGLLVERYLGMDHMVLPVPEPGRFFEAIRSSSTHPPTEGAYLWGALLYTDEDVDIASYVRRHFTSLNVLSGETLRVFVMEEPNDWPAAKRYWKQHLDEKSFAVWSNLLWLNTIPYEKSRAYELARALHVEEDQLPCLVLFDSLERRDKLIFPIYDASPSFFRGLFASLRRAMGDPLGEPIPQEGRDNLHIELSAEARANLIRHFGDVMDLTTLDEPLSATASEEERRRAFEAISRKYQSILRLLTPSTGVGDAERSQYTFEGKTVFINHPQGDVRISSADHEIQVEGQD